MFSEVPAGYQAHQEATTQVLTPIKSSDQPSEAFINPVQEYNRDLSIAAIRAWASIRNHNLRLRWQKAQEKRTTKSDRKRPLEPNLDHQAGDSANIQSKKLKTNQAAHPPKLTQDNHEALSKSDHPPNQSEIDLPAENGHGDAAEIPENKSVDSLLHSRPPEPQFVPAKFTALEALSATGLRAIRYAKEIPSIKWVMANDLSASAVKIIKGNITHNGLDPKDPSELGRVRVNQGDACDLMYSHRSSNRQFDIVDLDPYGTAAPFIDAAVQCVRDGGLLCVTCTDLAVLAGSSYPEKCFSNYGGSSMKAEYSHEYALRQVIHTLANSAARYGRYIQPLLSLSIDFYVRVFIRVHNSPADVKKLITNTALVYVCANCSAHHLQPLGSSTAKPTKSGTGTNVKYQNALGPPLSNDGCEECGGKFHVAGPMWSGPLHDDEFVTKVLEEADNPDLPLKTAARIKGMVGVAKMELPDTLFFFTPAKLSGLFHCSSPQLGIVASAILNAGYRVSRSHCQPGSIKTDAPRSFLHDIMRQWIKSNPVKMENVKETSPSFKLLTKPIKKEVCLDWNKEAAKKMMLDEKLVRYQSNPLPNWGPKSRAKGN